MQRHHPSKKKIIVKDPVGEVVTYAPYQPGINKYLATVQFLVLFWVVSWLVVFIILTFDSDRSFMNNWDALLIFMLGGALLVVAAQIILYMLYISGNNFAMSDAIGIQNIHFRTFMGQAHTKEIVLALFFSIVFEIVSGALWYDWLCRYKDSCSFNSDKSATSVTTILVTQAQMVEYRQYLVMNLYLVFFHLLMAYILIRAIWAHIRPLRAITHLISTRMRQELLVGKTAITKKDIL